MTNRDYHHSRPLDVHRWSDHGEINNLVNAVFEKFISRKVKENKAIRKKHLKLVLLDLYVAWLNDPDMNITVHMTMGAYSDGTVFNKVRSRYNELNIKVTTIDIVHRLRDAHLVAPRDYGSGIGWFGDAPAHVPHRLTSSTIDAALPSEAHSSLQFQSVCCRGERGLGHG